MPSNDLNRLAAGSVDGIRRLAGREDESSPDEVVVEYAPDDDGDADPGEVVWAWIPFEEDPTQGKDRPLIVIGHAGDRLAGIALSTKQHPDRKDRIPVGRGAWDSEGRQSWAKLERIYGLEPGQVRREGCRLDREVFDSVVDGLRSQRNWPDVEVDVIAPARRPGSP